MSLNKFLFNCYKFFPMGVWNWTSVDNHEQYSYHLYRTISERTDWPRNPNYLFRFFQGVSICRGLDLSETQKWETYPRHEPASKIWLRSVHRGRLGEHPNFGRTFWTTFLFLAHSMSQCNHASSVVRLSVCLSVHILRKSDQTCTPCSTDGPACRMCSRSRPRSKVTW